MSTVAISLPGDPEADEPSVACRGCWPRSNTSAPTKGAKKWVKNGQNVSDSRGWYMMVPSIL